MIDLIPVVRANSEIFAGAAAAHIGSQRMGDQFGALLAGAYALHSANPITPHEAMTWVKKQDWEEQTAINDNPDEILCLQRILQHTIKIPAGGRVEELSIGEMIEMSEEGLNPLAADFSKVLCRHGIRVEKDRVLIANQHSGIQKILAGTPWGDWARILRRIPGTIAVPVPLRFAGVKARATSIPRRVISD
jgi:putative DNA primase/helicase